MPAGPKQAGEQAGGLPEVPRLPERSAIYIAPDGNVQFGALFEGLVPVAEAISGGALHLKDGLRPHPAPVVSRDSENPGEPPADR